MRKFLILFVGVLMLGIGALLGSGAVAAGADDGAPRSCCAGDCHCGDGHCGDGGGSCHCGDHREHPPLPAPEPRGPVQPVMVARAAAAMAVLPVFAPSPTIADLRPHARARRFCPIPSRLRQEVLSVWLC